ncbi:MAS20 protein import receptor containing protein [Aphelenchoides avenae]|nr:MAS20 protein import receptor containing protein [Aphelenchus avenae]
MSLLSRSSWLSSSNLLAGAAVAGAAFVGYAIYFDHKRRSDPNYKQKIRENRRRKQQKARGGSSRGPSNFPNPMNPAEMQSFFLQEVQLGEELMAEGMYEEGVEHLCNAIVMCGQPQQLLQIFQQTLPPEQFELLVRTLPAAKQRIGLKLKEFYPERSAAFEAADEAHAIGEGGAHAALEGNEGPAAILDDDLE